jgi:BRCA1 C Terminus (BRCT) domain
LAEDTVGDTDTVRIATEDTPQCRLLTETIECESDNATANMHTVVVESSPITCPSVSECFSSTESQQLHLQMRNVGSTDPSPMTAQSPCARSAGTPPRFLFGGGDEEQFAAARRTVELLGGSVVWPVESSFDESCTHLVLWKMTRTEKYLCACAAGKVSLPLPLHPVTSCQHTILLRVKKRNRIVPV